MGPIPIRIEPWSPEWSQMYSNEVHRILVSTKAIVFHHIGSTSIPGCAAKPVIDLMGVFEHAEDYQTDQQVLTRELGYTTLGEYGVPGRDFLYRYSEANYHISVFRIGDSNIRNNIRLRDRLIENSELRDRYVALKQDLSRKYTDDYGEYNSRKSALIAEIIGN